MGEIASKGQLRLAFLRWAVVTVPLIVLLGFTSARIAPSGADNSWYAALVKPAGTPPDWLFPVAWTTIYILLGVALAMVLHARGSRLRGPALAMFGVQMLVNLIWSPLFFALHRITLSLVVIAVLFALVLVTTWLFGRIRSVAAWLLVPYLAWLVYAGALDVQIARLNPHGEALVPQTLAPSSSTSQIIG